MKRRVQDSAPRGDIIWKVLPKEALTIQKQHKEALRKATEPPILICFFGFFFLGLSRYETALFIYASFLGVAITIYEFKDEF